MAHLAKSIKLCYTYDVLNRVTKRTTKSMIDDTVLSEENFTYDAAGNVTNANGETAEYSPNNRIMVFNNSSVGCDLDGNLNSIKFDSGRMELSYDSKNRLTSAGNHTYTYDAEDVRIRNLCGEVDTTYAYDTNGKLSRLLMKTTNGVTTKYVYGLGLIGEERLGAFRYYHFDSRGSTVALTGGTGIVIDTFEYDTYGKMTSHVGNNEVIFGYNGRDGVVTDANGLLYMRARYYSPEMRRFINADVLAGEISDAITLNRYAYANGNPVSFVDPFGLKAESLHIFSFKQVAKQRLQAELEEKYARAKSEAEKTHYGILRGAGYIDGKYVEDLDEYEFLTNSEKDDTYQILLDLDKRWRATSHPAARAYYEGIAKKARELHRAGTPYMYGQDVIMKTMHENVEFWNYQKEVIPQVFELDPLSARLSFFIAFINRCLNEWDYKNNDDWRIPISEEKNISTDMISQPIITEIGFRGSILTDN